MDYGVRMTPKRSGDASFWILTALANGRRHGYAIIKESTELSGGVFQMKPTTLYSTLDKLEVDGLVALDGEDTVDGRHRTYFILTPAGHDELVAEIEEMEARARIARQRIEGRVVPKLGPAV